MAEKKFEIRKVTEGEFSVLQIAGIIDEQFNGKSLTEGLAKRLVIDLGGVKRMSSFGIREWLTFIKEAEEKCDEIYFISVPPRILDQFNMMADFGGKGIILSFQAPYHCDYCEEDHLETINVVDEWEDISQKKLKEKPCPNCGNPSYLDEDEEAFLSFVASQPKPEPDAELLSFLSHRLKYKLSKGGMKLKIDKYVGEATYFRLTGDLDDTFPAEKILEGLEGAVVFDLKGLGEITGEGLKRWAAMIISMPETVSEVYIKGAPEEFVEKLLIPEATDERVKVLDFFMAYSCDNCGTTMDRLIDVREHWEVLKFATPPELKCPDCGAVSKPKRPDVVVNISHLKEPKPSDALLSFIEEAEQAIRQRAQVVRREGGEAEGVSSGGLWAIAGMVLLLAVAVVGGGFFLYSRMNKGQQDVYEATERLIRSWPAKKPVWVPKRLGHGMAAAASKIEGGEVKVVGYSYEADGEEESIVHAKAAAVDNLLYLVASEVSKSNPLWKAVVFEAYNRQRNTLLSELDSLSRTQDSYIQIKQKVQEVRRILMNLVSGTILPQVDKVVKDVYRERYQAGTKVFYRTWVRLTLSKKEFDGLVKKFATTKKYKGVVYAPYFPALVWLHKDVREGVIVLSLETNSPFNEALKAGYIITKIQNDEIARPEDFPQRYEAIYKVNQEKRSCSITFHVYAWDDMLHKSKYLTAPYTWTCPKENKTIIIEKKNVTNVKITAPVNPFPDSK